MYFKSIKVYKTKTGFNIFFYTLRNIIIPSFSKGNLLGKEVAYEQFYFAIAILIITYFVNSVNTKISLKF